MQLDGILDSMITDKVRERLDTFDLSNCDPTEVMAARVVVLNTLMMQTLRSDDEIESLKSAASKLISLRATGYPYAYQLSCRLCYLDFMLLPELDYLRVQDISYEKYFDRPIIGELFPLDLRKVLMSNGIDMSINTRNNRLAECLDLSERDKVKVADTIRAIWTGGEKDLESVHRRMSDMCCILYRYRGSYMQECLIGNQLSA